MALPKRFAKMLTANSNFSYQQRKINRFFSVLPEKKAALVKMKVNLKKKHFPGCQPKLEKIPAKSSFKSKSPQQNFCRNPQKIFPKIPLKASKRPPKYKYTF
jgi:hypothetical protein